MSKKVPIAVDAFGGDYAPHEIVKGAIEAANQFPVEIILVGRKNILQMLMKRLNAKDNISIVNANQIIRYNEHPVQAIRNKPNSSIHVGINLVKNKDASAFVSAGNTGAILTSAYFNLKRVGNIERPALCGIIQVNPVNPVILIDVGANVDCPPSMLVQFAKLGHIFANKILNINEPRIGLLNIGEEEIKGNLITKETYQLLKKVNLNFIGNIEGHDILKGKTDIIVSDGFTGNILLKTMEGLGEFFHNLLPSNNASTILQNIQGTALVHYSELISTAKRMDYKEYGGASLLGVDGNVVVAHGRSQALAIKNAINLAYQMVNSNIIYSIQESYIN